MRKIVLFPLTLLSCSFLNAQTSKASAQWCIVGTTPKTDDTQDDTAFTNNTVSTRLSNPNGVIVIPVVFHVIHNTNVPAQDISDNVIAAQLARINADFRMLNDDVTSVPSVWASLVADMKYEFRLACIDPQGNSTNGIVRVATTHGPFSATPLPPPQGAVIVDPMLTVQGGDNAWLTDTYLNIWVCDMESGIEGAGTMPDFRTGSDITINGTPYPRSLFDGIVLDYMNVGDPAPSTTFNKGRTLTHEIGHWLGLWHLWGGIVGTSPCTPGDFVADTSPQDRGYFNCPVFPQDNPCSPVPSTDGVMFMNYMDYTQDNCKYFFTNGQKTRARNYFSQTGPLGTRFPYIQNYFSIKHFASTPVQVQNNRIIIKMNNPACLPVIYNIDGPITVINQTPQELVLSVACEASGTIMLTALSGNYIDDYTFNFVNPNSCGAWPKVYSGNKYIQLSSDNANTFLNLPLPNITPNFNHIGAVPQLPLTSPYIFQYNNLSGITNWVKENMGDFCFILNSGDIQARNNYPASIFYINGTTGALSTAPSLVPANHIILAETATGGYITSIFSGNNYNLYIHSSNGSNSIITDYFYCTKYNRNTNKLFAFKEKRLFVYDLTGNTFNYVTDIALDYNDRIVQVDNQDKIYIVHNGILQEFNYFTGLYTPLSIPGFTNNNIVSFDSDAQPSTNGPYTSDKCLVGQSSEENIYFLDLLLLAQKKIHTTNFLNSSNVLFSSSSTDYTIKNSSIFFAGTINNLTSSSIAIGNQQIPSIGTGNYSNYITKLDLQNDFSFSNIQPDKPIEIDKTPFLVSLMPNPAGSFIKVIIDEKIKQTQNFSNYTISILDHMTNKLLRREKYISGNELNISHLKPGIYYIEIANDKGERLGKIFSKL